MSQVEDILQMIQEFEPAGVGASNLRECLLLQLERHEGTPANLLAYKIIDKMFEEFSKSITTKSCANVMFAKKN